MSRRKPHALLPSVRSDLPESVIFVGQLTRIVSHSRTLSSLTLVGALMLALWSGMRAIRRLIGALNLIYEEKKRLSGICSRSRSSSRALAASSC